MPKNSLLKELARKNGTPLFVVDHNVLRANYAEFKRWLPRVQAYYAVKANPAPEIVRTSTRPGRASTSPPSASSGWFTRTSGTCPKTRQEYIWDKIIYANPIKDNATLEELDQYKLW